MVRDLMRNVTICVCCVLLLDYRLIFAGRVRAFGLQRRRETEVRIGCGCDLGPSFPALPLIQDDGL